MRTLVRAVVLLSLAGCATASRPGANAPLCPGVASPHVCDVPIEAVLADRERAFGQLLALHGVLVAGRPQASREPRVLLFPSLERADDCERASAIELIATDPQITASALELDYQRVRVVGIPRPSAHGAWLDFELRGEPVFLSDRLDSQRGCFLSPPPLPPEPPKPIVR